MVGLFPQASILIIREQREKVLIYHKTLHFSLPPFPAINFKNIYILYHYLSSIAFISLGKTVIGCTDLLEMRGYQSISSD